VAIEPEGRRASQTRLLEGGCYLGTPQIAVPRLLATAQGPPPRGDGVLLTRPTVAHHQPQAVTLSRVSLISRSGDCHRKARKLSPFTRHGGKLRRGLAEVRSLCASSPEPTFGCFVGTSRSAKIDPCP